MGTKSLYENGPNSFFSYFFNLTGTRMVQIRTAKSDGAFRNKLQTDLVPRFVCTSDNELQTDFARGETIINIWLITLLELKYIITSARNAAPIAKVWSQ